MKNFQLPYAAAVLLYLIACKSPEEKNQDTVDSGNNSLQAETISVPDTLRMRPERQVIFFLPGDEEINIMTAHDSQGQVIETISDFIYYSSMVCDSLSNSGILCAPVTSQIIMTQDTSENAYLFNRKQAQHITGMKV